MIGFRVDANEKIASGHVMRCLAIADALISLQEDVLFFVSDRAAMKMISARGHRVECLNSDWQEPESELPILLRMLRRFRLDMLLIDSYQVTSLYLEAVRAIVKVAYLDDLNAFDYPVDLVINYSIYADKIGYPAGKVYLLGPAYAPLRKQFFSLQNKLSSAIEYRKKEKSILITTGSSDPYHVAEKTVEEILEMEDLCEYKIIVVKGCFCYDLTTVEQKGSRRVKILMNIDNMAELMYKCSFAVSAGGSTLYELCACAVPTVTFSFVDNQMRNVEEFAKQRIMEYAGDARTEEFIGRLIVQKLLWYHRNPDSTKEMERRMRELGVADGSKRLAEAILAYIRERNS